MDMKRHILILFTFLFCTAIYAQAQNRAVTGIVSDGQGPLPGAIIFEKGNESNIVTTNGQGRFQIALAPSGSNVIVVRMLGLLTQELNVAQRNSVNVVLESDTRGLEEVVVVGYGTQKRITQTGATSQITGDEIRQNPSASIQNTLMGRVPGFTSQQRSGQPGSDAAGFNIRGANSYTGTASPLIIVDDIQFSQPLSDLDADQIESLTVLKDAASTAIYGIQGADGVIVIRTKRGVAGRPRITFRSETGLQSPTFPLEFLNSYQSATLANQAAANAGESPRWSQESLDHFRYGTDPYGHPDVNWAETILRKNSNQYKNNLNISGGTDKAKYFVSVGQLFQNGIMEDFSTKDSEFNSNYYYKRYNFRSNIDIQATKTLSVSLDLSGYMGEQNNPWLRGVSNNPFYELNDYRRLPPFAYPIYNPDGSYGGNKTDLANLAYNVVGRMRHLGYRRGFENGIVTNVTVRQDLSAITEGLSARGVFGYGNANSFSRNLERGAFPSFVYNSADDSYTVFDPATLRMPQMTLTTGTGQMNRRMNFQANLDYDRTFNEKHHVYGLALFNQYTRTPGANLPQSFRGFSFRTGYDYDLKYIVELVAGYNGTDKFAEQNRYALFPAASIGWNIAEEDFFKDNVKFIDLLKVRASHGLVGNDNIGGSSVVYEEKYVLGSNAYNFGETYGSSTNNLSRLGEGTLPNYDVRWEMERSSNLGVDINAFKGKFRLTTDFFKRYRYDILRVRQSVPSYAGVSFPPSNYASINTTGFEIDADYRDRIGEFSYSINGNMSVARSIIDEADEAIPEMPYQAQTGGYLGRVLGYVSDGFYTPENIHSSPKPGGTAGMNIGPGDLRYKDLNGDGIIDPKDRMRLEYPNLPSHIYGLNLGMAYKGLSFALTLQAATNFTFRAVSTQIVPFVNNPREVHLDTWTPENRDALLPRILPNWIGTINDPNTYVSDFWNIRGDYLRIKSAELAYSLPQRWVEGIKLNGIRVYANGNNLYTWMLKDKNLYNLDPESSGGQVMDYPQQKIWNFGLQVTF